MDILNNLLSCNKKFVETRASEYKEIENGQNPKITLVFCSDSRVTNKTCCDHSLNHIFSIENMGNQIYTAEGTMDYGIKHLKTPLLLIMGHTNCGAITASLTDYSGETEGIKRELNTLVKGYKEQGIQVPEEDPLRVLKYAEHNVDYQVREAMKKYSSLVNEGSLTIIGMMFDFTKSYGEKRGEIYITNVNTETEPDKIMQNSIFDCIDKTTLEAKIKRLT